MNKKTEMLEQQQKANEEAEAEAARHLLDPKTGRFKGINLDILHRTHYGLVYRLTDLFLPENEKIR